MNPKYKPKDYKSALGWLTEECGETLAALGKAQRWGLLSVNPELPPEEQETNVDWIRRELSDLKQAIALYESKLDSAVVYLYNGFNEDGGSRNDHP